MIERREREGERKKGRRRDIEREGEIREIERER